MLRTLLMALLIAIAVGLIVLFIAIVLGALNAPITEDISKFLKQWAWAIGVLVGLFYLVANWTGNWPTRNNP